jgi:hypothetical protein
MNEGRMLNLRSKRLNRIQDLLDGWNDRTEESNVATLQALLMVSCTLYSATYQGHYQSVQPMVNDCLEAMEKRIQQDRELN